MDDYKLMGADEKACRCMEASFDQFLSTQGLSRSVENTEYYSDTPSAIAALRDGRLDSLGYCLRSGSDDATDELHSAFEREILGATYVARSSFRWFVRTLGNRGDDFGVTPIVNNLDLANIDPKLSGEYLGCVGLTQQAVVDAMLSRLRDAPSDRTDALDLHFIRALSKQPGDWGTEEGGVFQSIAENCSRRSPVRCWAVYAFSRTSRWRQSSLMESAEAEVDPLVRRIKVSTLSKVRPSGRKRTQFLQHMCAKYPELAPTVLWLNAA